ncbi:hypothetical protein [Mucilaginibacter sp.]|jgi:hypothetical protein|uniref:hypothetical protein n=1 Tax=Mucilaginibacter sp. TaxID=1882438 RepID=UPI003567EC2A
MEKMKSLADQLREQMVKPGEKPKEVKPKKADGKSDEPRKKITKVIDSAILKALSEYDNSDHKTLVHFRFNKPTVDFLNQFKIATGIDATKFAAFSVRHLIETNPELKTIIKQFIQNSEL